MTKFKSQPFDEYLKSGRAKLYPISKEAVDLAMAEGRPQDIPYMQRPGGKQDGSDLLKYKNPYFKMTSAISEKVEK